MSPSIPTPHAHIVVTEFEGGDSVLVDLNTKRYYQLNETATAIWRGLTGGCSKAALIESLTSAYEVTAEVAEKSVDDALEHFRVHRLVTMS